MNIKERIRNFADKMTAKGWDYGRIATAISKNLDINKRQAMFLLSSAIGASFGMAPMMNPAKKEKVLWGVRKGNEDWQEEVLISRPAAEFDKVKDKVIKLATADGFHKFRTSEMDLTKAPDFRKTIRKNPIDPQGVAAWLEAAYHDERKGIIEYEKLYKRIEGVPEYAPLRKALKRIIKDEKRHFNALSRILGF